MKYLGQLTIILGFSFAGELLAKVIPLPIPASFYGLVLLLLALALKLVKPAHIRETAEQLLSLLPVMFVAPVLGLLAIWDTVKPFLLPILVIIAVSTLASFVVSGCLTQKTLKKGAEDRDLAAK